MCTIKMAQEKNLCERFVLIIFEFMVIILHVSILNKMMKRKEYDYEGTEY